MRKRQSWNNVLRTMDQREHLTSSCWVPCLIGHKEVPASLASPVPVQSKIYEFRHLSFNLFPTTT